MNLLINNKLSYWNTKSKGILTLNGVPKAWNNGITANIATVTGLGNSDPSTVTFTVDAGFSTTFDEVTRSGNIFIKIPTMYRKVNNVVSDQITSFTMSDNKIDSLYVPYPCFVAPDGEVLPYILIGKYLSSSNTVMNSVNAAHTAQKIDVGRTNARALGTGYQLYDWQMHKLFQDLCIIDKRTINVNNGTGFDSILGIAHQSPTSFIDGLAKDASGNWLFAYDPANYINQPTTSSAGYYAASYSAPTTTNREVQKLGFDSNHPFLNQCSAIVSNSSYNTYYCDMYQHSSSSRGITTFAGYVNSYSGPFLTSANASWTATAGARLCYRPIFKKDWHFNDNPTYSSETWPVDLDITFTSNGETFDKIRLEHIIGNYMATMGYRNGNTQINAWSTGNWRNVNYKDIHIISASDEALAFIQANATPIT